MTVAGSKRSAGRGLARRALLAVPAAGGLVVLVAAPALAATFSGATPNDGATVTNSNNVNVGATGGQCGGSLSVDGPGSFSRNDSTSAASGSLGVSFTPRSVANGDYSASVTTYKKPGTVLNNDCAHKKVDANASRTFHLKVAPAAPSSLSSSTSGRSVTLDWNVGDEPDLVGYAVRDAVSGSALGTVYASSCSSTCSWSHDYGTSAASGQQSYTVQAVRDDGSGGQLGSAASNTSASIPAAPKPSPSSGGSGSGSGGSGGGSGGSGTSAGSGTTTGTTTGGGSGGSTGSGGSGGGHGKGGGILIGGGGGGNNLSFNASSGSIILPPSLSGGSGTSTRTPGNPSPVVGGPSEGKFKQTLPYGSSHSYLDKERHQTVAGRFVSSVTGVFHGERLMRSLALMLVFLLAAGHLRAWSTRPIDY
jgi:hypothetical protein